jgi:hypothetical protein
MKAQNLFISLGVALSTLVATASMAKAQSFTSNVSQTIDPKADILLISITQNGKTFSNFSYINRANILFNTPINPKNIANSGAASTDRGDNALSIPLLPKADPTGADIATYLGNNNLNYIIDTEDAGSFTIDVFFDSQIIKDESGLSNIFYWERGQNSFIDIQALDAFGNLIGNKLTITETTNPLNYAGFRIDTTEGVVQDVGSWSVSLDSLGVNKLSGLRLIANGRMSRGPDFKLIGRRAVVPEPAGVLGLGAIATLALLRRRQLKSNFSRKSADRISLS